MSMKTLNLYTERSFNIVKLADGKEYKIPNELTVEEVERLLERQIAVESVAQQKVDGDGNQQLRQFWDLVFQEIEILFQHFHPKTTADELRKILTYKQALDIIGFYKSNRYGFGNEKSSDGKKKT